MSDQIKSCSILLVNHTFAKIRMGCSATSDGEQLECTLKQEGVDSFSIKISHKHDGILSEAAGSNRNDFSDVNASKGIFVIPIYFYLYNDMYLSTCNTLKSWFLVSTLRPHEKKMDEQPKIQKKSNKSDSRALVLRRPKLMPNRCQTVEIGQVILYRLSGFCEWPAEVTSVDGIMAHIKFFGDRTTQKSKIANFFKFEDSHEIILYNLRNRKTALYRKSVREAEIVLGIPEQFSILNQI